MQNNLKKILKEKGLTQKELSLATGITECAISRYVNNSRLPKLKNMLKIASALEINIEEIYKEDN